MSYPTQLVNRDIGVINQAKDNQIRTIRRQSTVYQSTRITAVLNLSIFDIVYKYEAIVINGQKVASNIYAVQLIGIFNSQLRQLLGSEIIDLYYLIAVVFDKVELIALGVKGCAYDRGIGLV